MNKYRSRAPLPKRPMGTETHGDRRNKRKRTRKAADDDAIEHDGVVVETYRVLIEQLGIDQFIQSTSPIDACVDVCQQANVDTSNGYEATVICSDDMRFNVDTSTMVAFS